MGQIAPYGESSDLLLYAWEKDLEEECQSLTKRLPLDLLVDLNDRGFAWRDIARMMHVSVPAIQKWRRGEKITGANRLKLASLVALITKVERDMIVNDPASWFEMNVKSGVAVTPIDLVAHNKPLLVLQFASGHSPVDEVLNEFDSDWRERYVDHGFETFVASDGNLSIRPREQ